MVACGNATAKASQDPELARVLGAETFDAAYSVAWETPAQIVELQQKLIESLNTRQPPEIYAQFDALIPVTKICKLVGWYPGTTFMTGFDDKPNWDHTFFLLENPEDSFLLTVDLDKGLFGGVKAKTSWLFAADSALPTDFRRFIKPSLPETDPLRLEAQALEVEVKFLGQ
jgi:hypothetical protein